jgi:hypothetical protein
MSFSFPDGMIPEITSPLVMLTDPQLNSTNLPQDSADLFKPTKGDYPFDSNPADAAGIMTNLSWFAPPGAKNTPAIGVVYRAALFDWFRRAGTKANLDSVVAQLSTPFNPNTSAGKATWVPWVAQVPPPAPVPPPPPPPPAPPPIPKPPPVYPSGPISPITVGMNVPSGIMHIYKFTQSGTVVHSSTPIQPFPYPVLSQDQLYAVSYNAFVSKDTNFPLGSPQIQSMTPQGTNDYATVTLTNNWDVFIRDECRQPGKLLGGQHAGEPMSNAFVALAPEGLNLSDIAWNDKGGSGTGAQPGGGQGQGPGLGSVPILTEQDGWARNMWPYEPNNGFGTVFMPYQLGPAAGAVRPTYATNGTAFDIRFRRQVSLINASVPGVGKVGYMADI